MRFEQCARPRPHRGAGLPGLIAACGGLVALARRRRHLDGTTIVSGDLVINSHDLIFGAQGYLGSSVNIGPSTFNIDLTVALCAPPNCTRTDLGSFYDFTYGSLNAQYPFGFILPGNGEHIGGYFDYGNLHGYLLTRDLSPVLVPAPATFAGEFLAGLLLLLLCR
jgi:hypothetical protein